MYLPLPYPYTTSKESSMQKQTVVITDSKVTEVFDSLVDQCDTTEVDQKIATSEKIFAEKHTVPSEYEVMRISTRKKVEFTK